MTLAHSAQPTEFRSPLRLLTRTQVQAIRAAMQTFVDEDASFGRGRMLPRWCVYCQMDRPGPGFIAYDCGDFCNECATDFEMARAQGLVRTVAEFYARRSGDTRKRLLQAITGTAGALPGHRRERLQ